MNMNGGFPPLRYVDKNKHNIKDAKKERYYSAPSTNDLDIKHILANSVVKPMIDFGKNEVEIISSL
jgi:hypothetical protein